MIGRTRSHFRRLHGLNHVGVTVSDFEAACRWYREMFNFHLVNDLRLGPEQTKHLVSLYGEEGLSARLGFLAGQSEAMLEIFEFTPPHPDPGDPHATLPEWTKPGYSHAAISVTNVPEVKAALEAKGMEFITDVQFVGGAHWAFGKDPDGNLIELIDYHTNRLPLKFIGNLVGKLLRRTQFRFY
ncbi:MAG: VOC family protein [Corynebacterium sp.]|nr:VOC family protein [Corynebacterium sp.]